jgi:hypothetical protein
MSLRSLWVLSLCALLLGCTPKIGNSCNLSTDCSPVGDRLCDTTQPNGYCTIFNCEPDQCPSSICVAFDTSLDPACGQADNGRSPRFEQSFCMAPCSSNSDCRAQYQCVDLSVPANQVTWSAEVVDLAAADGGYGFSVCMAATCGDGIKDGTETDIDCGGGQCRACNNRQHCSVGSDCTSGTCSVGTCVDPTCTDGKQDGSESDVDCGGPKCAPCVGGQGCFTGTDCASGVCPVNPSAMPPMCTPASCSCEVPGNCSCLAGSCTDGIKDGAETDVDCGGPGCSPCANALRCIVDSDCISLNCSGAGGQCLPPAVCSAVNDDFPTDGGVPWTPYSPDGG